MRILSTYHHLAAGVLLWLSGSCQGQHNATNPRESHLCHVCGDGMIIGQASPIVTTDFGMFTCGGLAGAGRLGHIHDCGAAQTAAMERCACIPDGSGGVPAQTPPAAAPTSMGIPIPCTVCSDGKFVTNRDGLLTIPGHGNRTCANYIAAVRDRNITASQCNMLREYAAEPCGCSDTPGVDHTLAPEPFQCSICGTGMYIGNPDSIVSHPTEEDITCGDLAAAGRDGLISHQSCAFLQSYARSTCTCVEEAPSAAPSPNDGYFCNICGEGNMVTNPDGVAYVPTQADRTCGEYLIAAEALNITEDQCALLQGFVFAPCGCAPADTVSPTIHGTEAPTTYPTDNTEPTHSPAPTPYFTAREGCFSDLTEIHGYESAILDSSLNRKYVLCPGTTFDIGIVDNDVIVDGQPFLMLRPNVWYQCGESGSRSNKCIFRGGDFGVASFYGVFEEFYETVENVKIQGITFESQNLFAVVLEAAGDVSFVDCSFEMHANKVPILIQWRGDDPHGASSAADDTEEGRRLRKSVAETRAQDFYHRMRSLPGHVRQDEQATAVQRMLESTNSHSVTFQSCMFAHNTIIDDMAYPGIIENTFGSELNIVNCLFEKNRYGDEKNTAPFGYAVRSFGPLNITNTCFIDNTFLKYGPVLLYGATYSTTGNYVESSQTDLDCRFLALFTDQNDATHDSPTCVEHEEDTCSLETYQPDLTIPDPPSDPTPTEESQPTELKDGSGSTRQIPTSVFVVLSLTAIFL